MGNTQANEKQHKSGKSPAKGKNFIKNLNRKSPGKGSRKRKKSDVKREAFDRREFDKTPDSDNNEPIDISDNDTVECVYTTSPRDEGEGDLSSRSVHSEVTVSRCERTEEPTVETSSPTRDQSSAAPSNSNSDSVFTDPLTPLAVELNQCYYSAESDSVLEDLPRTLTPSQTDAIDVEMPHETLSLSNNEMAKEEKNVDDSNNRSDNEKVMGSLFSASRGEQLERATHECNHEFRENRLKACPGQTSFTLSKHKKVELPPVASESSLTILDNAASEKDRRHSSVSDAMLESNVLRKVASLTLEKMSESKVVRPKFVPEKLDFQLYEKFEGQMLLNWFVSSIADNNHLKQLLTTQDLKNLGIQYCTHLLAAGVLRQISDKDAPAEKIFKPNLMYFWAHMEVPMSQPVTPGKLQMPAWPPDKDLQHPTPEHISNCYNAVNNRLFSHNNNEETTDNTDDKLLIAQLRKKLQDLELRLEKYNINVQIEALNKNIDESFGSSKEHYLYNKIKLVSREVQTSNFANDANTYSDNPVINIPEYDLVRTNVDIDKILGLSNSTSDSETIRKYNEIKSAKRSENIENYCKLNKSRESNKTYKNDGNKHNINDAVQKFGGDETTKLNETSSKITLSSSDSSFLTAQTSDDTLNKELEKSTQEMFKEESLLKKVAIETHFPVTCDVDQQLIVQHNKLPGNKKISQPILPEKELTMKEQKNSPEASCPVSPVKAKSQHYSPFETAANIIRSDCSTDISAMTISSKSSCLQSEKITNFSPGLECENLPAPLCEINKSPLSMSPTKSPAPNFIPPPPPPMPIAETSSFMSYASPPPPMLGMEPLISGMGPPPPPMPETGPPPPPMPGMGPPPPPMPGIGPPPPPPMPGIGPPPPPMPGLGPPPPPMPGMGLPPPPMPGMGPPPPPMPGIFPPPPLTSGIGPPPPPMSGFSASTLGPPPPPGLPVSNSGPVPFPPPPIGGWNTNRATLRKTPVKPAAPMKPLYWTRILAAPTPVYQEEPISTPVKPLWLEIEETNIDNIEEFTDLFSRQVVKAPVKKKVEVKTKIQPVKILDSKRSQNVGILAQSLHVEFSEIENAIYNFDTSVVSLEALQQIYELRATDEELSCIKEHLNTKPEIPLDKPEAFLHDLSGIPNFAERISCFMFQAEFEDAVSTTMHKLDNLKHTCEFLITSEHLKKLFAIILTLGNYMNGGNGQRGQADGFGLEILSKLKDVKSKQSNVTLLHFIVRTYMSCAGGALSAECVLPIPEPGDVARAAALDFADVAASLDDLQKQLEACKEKSKKVTLSDIQCEEPENGESSKRLDVFKDKMTTFINAAEEKLKTENENLEECRNKFMATIKFYQYHPKGGKAEDCEPKEFFSLWTSFCSDFKDIFKKQEQIAIKEKLKEAKKLQEGRKSLTQPKKEGGLKARLQKLSSTKK